MLGMLRLRISSWLYMVRVGELGEVLGGGLEAGVRRRFEAGFVLHEGDCWWLVGRSELQGGAGKDLGDLEGRS